VQASSPIIAALFRLRTVTLSLRRRPNRSAICCRARLQRALSHVKFLCGLSSRVALDRAKQKRGAQQWRQLAEILADYFAEFCSGKQLLGIRRISRETLR
jgi:hypothetical protein